MAESRVASRYVKSLLGLAQEQKALEAVHKDMLLFSAVCEQNRAFTVMLRSPIIRHDKKKQILLKLFTGRVNPLTLAFFDIITRKNREAHLPDIARTFHDAYNEFMGIVKASVTTAMPLDESLRKAITSTVRTISKKDKIELVEKVKEDMIGGFVLNVGDRQIDASIKNKLRALYMKFSENPFIKDFN